MSLFLTQVHKALQYRTLIIGWTQFCPFEDLDFPEEAWVGFL
jgi:hypothetical protein